MIDPTFRGCLTKAEHDEIVARIGRPVTQDLPHRRSTDEEAPDLSLSLAEILMKGGS